MDDFACRFLKYNKFQIFCGDTQILTTNKKLLSLPKLKPFYMTNSESTDVSDNESVQEIDLSTLKRLGFILASKKSTFKGSRVNYVITRPSMYNFAVSKIPSEHHINFDIKNDNLQLIGPKAGPLGFGPIINAVGKGLPKDMRTLNYFKNEDLNFASENILKELIPFDITEEQKEVVIKESPIGVSDFGEIVCIEKPRDAISFEICGNKRLGKSLLLHNLEDNIFWRWKPFCSELNDINSESITKCQTWTERDELSYNLKAIGIKSIPLPMVYIYPTNTSLEHIDYENITGYKMSISSSDMFGNYFDSFFSDEKTQWSTGGSTKYMKNLIFDDEGKLRDNALFTHKNLSSCMHYIDEVLKEKSHKTSKPKIKEIIKNIWSEKLIDSASGIPGKWFLKFPDGHVEINNPWTVCNMAGLFPVIESSHLKSKHYHPEILRYITETIYFNQKNNIHMKNKDNYLFIDEMVGLLKNERSAQSVETIIREGGSSNTGVIYVAHSPKDVKTTIRMHSAYVACFGLSSSVQAKKLVEDIGLDNKVSKSLVNQKKFECHIFPKNGYRLVLYDTNGNKYHTTEYVHLKKIFPSISAHKPPKIQDEDEIDE